MTPAEAARLPLSEVNRRGLEIVFRSEVLAGQEVHLIPDDFKGPKVHGRIYLPVREALVLLKGETVTPDELRTLMRAREVFQGTLWPTDD